MTSRIVDLLGTLRLAERRDAQGIADAPRDAFAEFETRYTGDAFLATVPTSDRLLERWEEGPVWVFEQEGTVLGTVGAVLRPGELYIRSMAVRREGRGRRLGAVLLETAERYGLEHGCHRLVLATTPFLAGAISLYEKHGFRRTGESALVGTPLFVMTKDLAR